MKDELRIVELLLSSGRFSRLYQIAVERLSHQQALRESLLRSQLTEAELRALRAQNEPNPMHYPHKEM